MMKNRYFFTSLVVIMCIMFASGFFFASSIQEIHKNPKINYNVIVLKDGTQIGDYQGNTITDIGETFIRDWTGLAGSGNTTSRTAVQYISLSNDASPLQTWTKLPNEVASNGFDRQLATVVGWTNAGDSAWNLTKDFTCTGTQTLQTAGAQWSATGSSDGNLFACASFTQTAFSAGDHLTIIWVFTIDAN